LTAHHVHARFDEQDAVLAHGETQAGTPPTCAAIVATIEEMARLDVATRAARLGSMLDERLADPPTIHRLIRSASGVGCFRALRLAGPDGHPFTPAQVEDAVDAIRVSGAIVHPGPGAIQLIPPLVYTEDDLEELFECVVRGLDRLG
jgi:adenosylmethionine-8-amino-7-oxononanoate aminotransferase